jgi:hypothetical protein
MTNVRLQNPEQRDIAGWARRAAELDDEIERLRKTLTAIKDDRGNDADKLRAFAINGLKGARSPTPFDDWLSEKSQPSVPEPRALNDTPNSVQRVVMSWFPPQ